MSEMQNNSNYNVLSGVNGRHSRAKLPAGPWLRRIVVTLGPLEEWRDTQHAGSESSGSQSLQGGRTVRFESDGTPKGLKVTGNFQKAIMGMARPSTISVYNLSRDTRDAIRANLTKITVEVGRKNTELHTLFQGSVTAVQSDRSGSDIVTKITAQPGYGGIMRGTSSLSFGPGTPVSTIVKALAQDMPGVNIVDTGIEGLEGNIDLSGWSFTGSSRDALSQLANEFHFSWSVDNGVFKAVGDKASFGGPVELSGSSAGSGYASGGRKGSGSFSKKGKNSGSSSGEGKLIDTSGTLISVTPCLNGPTQEQAGVSVQSLYVPGATTGGIVRVNSSVTPKLNGDYRIHSCNINIDAYSDQWTMDIEGYPAGSGGVYGA